MLGAEDDNRVTETNGARLADKVDLAAMKMGSNTGEVGLVTAQVGSMFSFFCAWSCSIMLRHGMESESLPIIDVMPPCPCSFLKISL